jgi:hypothetical protein
MTLADTVVWVKSEVECVYDGTNSTAGLTGALTLIFADPKGTCAERVAVIQTLLNTAFQRGRLRGLIEPR